LDGAVQDDGGPADGGRSIQETYYPDLTCFGCGHGNERGLRLRSYEVDGVVCATFMPWPEHDNGGGYLNGGIISTILDCHGAAAVLLEAHRRGWKPSPGNGLAFVTAGLDVRFRRPTPLYESVELTAELLSVAESEMTVVAHVAADGRTRATGTAVWKRWRPRT
jgi:acyl-coenzyme A thioesterase PaaI-like protein